MKRLSCYVLLMVLMAGCSPAAPPPVNHVPPKAGTDPKPAPAKPAPPVEPVAAANDQDKLRTDLAALGVGVNNFGELEISANALTADGDFKPGIAAKLAQLQSVRTVQALDLPAFAAGAAQKVAALPGVTDVRLWRTMAPDAAIAALGGCPTLERISLNNGSGEQPIVSDAGLAGFAKLKNVTSLQCEQGQITGAGLAAVAGFTKLEELNLSGCPVDDAAGPHLAKLTNLQSLNLSGSKISGAGLAVLKGLPKLSRLALDRTSVSDADVATLAVLPKLQSLSIGGTQITDAGLAPLAALPELATLQLGGAKVTDVGAAALAKSKSLGNLELHDTKVTDAGIAALAAMPKLRSLTLFRLPLTDASLDALAKAPELNNLWLADNKFTEAGLAKFTAARPKVTIFK